MSRILFVRIGLLVAAFAPPLAAQDKHDPALLPPPDRVPQLILAHGGPHAPINALAFSPDGATLFVGGFDKQVRRYQLNKGTFTARESLRIPIGPGNAGVVNAVAVSPDGKWIAVAGRAPIRGEIWSRAQDGIGEDSRHLTPLMKRDAGVVYLFDPTNPNGGTVIRGLQSEVRALAFANPAPATGPVLVAAGIEWDDQGDYSGTVRAFNVKDGKEIAQRRDLPNSTIPPGLAAWATGAKADGLRVVVGWDAREEGKLQPSKLLAWDIPAAGPPQSTWEAEALLISPVAVRLDKDGQPAEVLTGGYDLKQNTGGLRARTAGGGAIRTTELKGDAGQPLVPVALAAVSLNAGPATALLLPIGANDAGRQYELRLVTAKGDHKTTLEGFTQQPVLAASPDGRFLAVAGFADNRVEVFDAVAFAAGKVEPLQKLAGAADGFRSVAFVAGPKLWLGRKDDTPAKGGVVLDLDGKARVAAPAKGAQKVDEPVGVMRPTPRPADAVKKLPGRVRVTVKGVEREIELPQGETVTAAAFLPGAPAWDAQLGPIVAVAHIHERSQTVLVTVYDAATRKPLMYLGGPTLPIRSLAYSGSRALLAAAGDDGTVAVWSLKDIARKVPTIEGVLLIERGGEVVVARVASDSPAVGKLKADDVIESVADAKGVQQPVKVPHDIGRVLHGLKVGDNVQVKLKGAAAAVAIPVGSATGFRYPLCTLWVDPERNDGRHDWIGWSFAGPYDASGAAGEDRIGWLTATGDPTHPTAFAGAEQYRKLFYMRGVVHDFLDTADFDEAIRRRPVPAPPKLTATVLGAVENTGVKRLARRALEGVEVTLRDPDRALDLDAAVVRWQVSGPDGAGEWKQTDFKAARFVVPLNQHTWKRGDHCIHVKLYKSADAPANAPPVDETTALIEFRPPPPKVVVLIDGKEYAPGTEIVTKDAAVQVSATVETKDNPAGATVTVTSTAGGKPIELARNKDGTFGPKKLELLDGATTGLLVTATNAGASLTADESVAVPVRVRKQPAPEVPRPVATLTVLTTHDTRLSASAPFVLSTRTAVVRATVASKQKVEHIEWKIGDRAWEAKALDATRAETREIELPDYNDNLPPDKRTLHIQVRAKSAKSQYGGDAVAIVFEPLPDVTVPQEAVPPGVLTEPELNLSGGLRLMSKRKFHVRVIVASSRRRQTREFTPTPNDTLTAWSASITLFPGVNQIGYIITDGENRRELRREILTEVSYLRPPIVAGSAPIDAGTGAVGDLALAVLSPAEAPPSELWVNSVRVGFDAKPTPVTLAGVPLWLVKARGVPVTAGGARLKAVPVVVRNGESDSRAVRVAVEGKQVQPALPPTIDLSHGRGAITDAPVVVGDVSFPFRLKVNSETPLARVEVWQSARSADPGEEVGKLNAADAVKAPGGFEFTAIPTLRLRAGMNFVRIIAANESKEAAQVFVVSYTPPPVRVIIDTIQEPNGQPVSVRFGPEARNRVASPVVELSGRIEWDFDNEPIARDTNLYAVFSANGVDHLPVPVPVAGAGKVRKFSGRVFLNARGHTDPTAAAESLVRVELRSGDRPVPIPQQAASRAQFRVTSTNPLRDQRLHLVILGVDVPEAERRQLIKSVVEAVGGEVPQDDPNFRQGRFTRRNFRYAYLHTPELGYTNQPDVTRVLCDVRNAIKDRARLPGEDYVNDVIVIYYQGLHWVEKDGRWLLHSGRTLRGTAGPNPADKAIRLDNLMPLPGLPAVLVNGAGTDAPDLNLMIDQAILCYTWTHENAAGRLLTEFKSAVRAALTVREIAQLVDQNLQQVPPAPKRSGSNLEEFLERIVGYRSK